MRHSKILIFALILSMFTQTACFADMNNFSPMFGMQQMFMNNNNDRFLPMGIEPMGTEPVKPPVKKKPLFKKNKNENTAAEPDKVEIISDHMDYFRDEDKIVATGNAVVISADKQSKMKADKITFYRDINELIAEGNVRVLKNNAVVYGSFMRVDLNKNTGFMANPKTGNSMIKVVAREGYVYSKDMEFLKGHAKFAEGFNIIVSAMGIHSGFEDLDNKRMQKLSQSPKYCSTHPPNSYKIKAKEIVIESGEDRNLIKMKGSTIYKNKKKLGAISKFVASGDVNMGEMETSLPAIGYTRQLGTFLGPSFLLDGPKNSTIRLSPVLMYDGSGGTGDTGSGGAGIGGIAKFRTDTNMTELAYGTPREKLILKGRQEFSDPRYTFNYASNAFMDDWFMGGKMPYRFTELAFRDTQNINDLGLVYNYKYSGAIASDYKVGSAGDWRMNTSNARRNLPNHDEGWSTLKLKAQGEFMRQSPIWEVKDKATLNFLAQYDINQYGTGQTYAIVRTGPTFLYTPNDRFRMRSTYYISGIHGESPFAWDRYYLGKQSVSLSYEYQFTKKLAIGASNTLNLLKDNFDERFLAENRLYFKYGPEDFKFCFSYDTLWKRTAMGIDMLLGAENSDVEFDKLKVKNYKKLQKQKEKQREKEEKLKKRNEEKV